MGYPYGWYDQYGMMPDYTVPGYGMGGYGMPGYEMPGYGMPGYGIPGYAMPGYGMDPMGGFKVPGYGMPGYGMEGMGGYTMPGYTMPGGYGIPGYEMPGYGMPGYGMSGYGMPSYGMPGYGGVDPIQQQMAAMQQQIDMWLIEQMRPFINYYRESTGDYQTPDAEAMERGQNLWCTNFPVECERAMNTVSPEAQEWMDQSAAAHEQRMMDNQQRFDMWWQGAQKTSASQDAWQRSFLGGVIQGE